ncbi:MAG: hypothetical protein KC422_26210, partial [Trueperaceae bacterium]|nr:hypothetical protein [Trueperaceae bacterium]
LAKSRNDMSRIAMASCSLATAMVLAANPTGALELAAQATEFAQMPGQTLNACTNKAAATEALGRRDEAFELWSKAKNLAEEIGQPYNLHIVGLELDRLNNDIENARVRMQWFEERGLMNGVNIAKRYFPDLAEQEGLHAQKLAVRLEVLGSLQITGSETKTLRGRKRQELLALLLEARMSGRKDLSKLSLLDQLYPDEDELKANSSLKTTIHHLRESLGQPLIETTSGGYALANCESDAELFLATRDTRLWRGVYLEGLERFDSNVQEALYLALFQKAEALLSEDPDEVARVAKILIEAEPYELGYLALYLRALRLCKNHNRLARHYQEARTRMLEVGESLPETWQAFLSQS